MPALFEGGLRSYYFADNLFSDRFTGILKCAVAQCISLISNAVHRSGTIDVEARPACWITGTLGRGSPRHTESTRSQIVKPHQQDIIVYHLLYGERSTISDRRGIRLLNVCRLPSSLTSAMSYARDG